MVRKEEIKLCDLNESFNNNAEWDYREFNYKEKWSRT